MVNLGYLPAYFMPLISSTRYNIVLMAISVISIIYSLFFISSNFLPCTFTDDDKHIFTPNEQDYFRTCLLGIFSPMLFNIIKNIMLKLPIKHTAFKVIINIFIESCVYDWFMFLIIFFLAYPQIDIDGNIKEYDDKDDITRNVFHIIPKQSYILAICWSLSECIISVLENMSVFQEVLTPKLVAKEELGISKPKSLRIFYFIFIKIKDSFMSFFNMFVINVFKFIYKICYNVFSGIAYLFRRKNTIELEQYEADKNEKQKFSLLKQLDVSKCTEALQKAMMRQRSMQYQTSDMVKTTPITAHHSNSSSTTQENMSTLDFKHETDLTSNPMSIDEDKNMEEVVLINFKEETMRFAKINQDDFNYGSINKLTINNSNATSSSNMSQDTLNNKLVKKPEMTCKNKMIEFIMDVLKMRGKPRPGNLYTNKNIWQLKKESETKKLEYLEQQKKEKLHKYNEKLFAFQQQKQLLTKNDGFMNQNDFVSGTNKSLQGIQSTQYADLQQVEQNLNTEAITLRNYYQKQFDVIRDSIDYYNEKSKKYQAMLREQNSTDKNSSSNDIVDGSFDIVYNFYRIDNEELFFKELKNIVLILLSNITTLIGEVLIFSIYFIYVPSHNQLFTPCVNYFGDKSFGFFTMAVLLPYTLINFAFQFTLFFWSKLRQEYYFTNRINEFELLWGIDDEIMDQVNSNKHMQNLDVSMTTRMNENGSSQAFGYGNDIINGDLHANNINYGRSLQNSNRTYNPFKWVINLFGSNRGSRNNQIDDNYDYYYSLDNDKNQFAHGTGPMFADSERSPGKSSNRVLSSFLNYDRLSGSKGSSSNGSFNSNQFLNQNDPSSGLNQPLDYYQTVINNLNPGIDPLNTGGNINNTFSAMNDDGAGGIVNGDDKMRNMSILSTHELKMLNGASLMSSNLTIKEIFLVVMYRVRQVVIKWRLASENSTVMITFLLLFGIVSFCLGIFLTVTDIFLYFDHD